MVPGAVDVVALTTRPVVARAVARSCGAAGLHFFGVAGERPSDASPEATLVVDLQSIAAPPVRSVGPVVVLTPPIVDRALLGSLTRGIDALVTLSDGIESLTMALESVARGDAYLTTRAARLLLSAHVGRALSGRTTPEVRLSRRDQDVLRALVDGLSAKATARRLGIAVKTVEAHRTRVFNRLDVRTRGEAVARALTEQGLLDAR